MPHYSSFYSALSQETRRKVGWLSDTDIADIRKQLAQGVSRLALARQYRVSYSTLQRIDRGLDKYTYPSSSFHS
jgi:hypothetical protein